MFGCLGCLNRLSMLAIMLFGLGSAAMMTVIVLSTGGLGGSDVVKVNLPIEIRRPQVGVGAGEPVEEIGTARVNDVVEKRKLFENVPLPSEISKETPVIVTNFSLAVIFAILFGILTTIINNLIRDKEHELQAWISYFYLDRIFLPLKAAQFLADQDVQRGCLNAPIIVFIFAAYGVIFALLEPGVNLLTPAGIQLAIVLALSIGLISLAGDVAQRRVAWIWRKTARFGVYPANLAIAALTTGFSRLLTLSPGILFGVPGGIDVDKGEEEPRFQDAALSIATLVVVVAFGAMGWGITSLMREAGDRTLSGEQLEFVAPLVQLGLALGLALFAVAVQTAFFEMVPLSYTMGTKIFRWNPLIWVVGFIPVMFVFAHTLLNPESEYLDVFEQTPVVVLTAITLVLLVLLGGLWIFFQVFDPPNLHPPTRSYGQPYQQYPQQPPYPPQQPPGGYPPQQPPQYPPQQGYPPPGQYPGGQQPPPPQRRDPPR